MCKSTGTPPHLTIPIGAPGSKRPYKRTYQKISYTVNRCYSWYIPLQLSVILHDSPLTPPSQPTPSFSNHMVLWWDRHYPLVLVNYLSSSYITLYNQYSINHHWPSLTTPMTMAPTVLSKARAAAEMTAVKIWVSSLGLAWLLNLVWAK